MYKMVSSSRFSTQLRVRVNYDSLQRWFELINNFLDVSSLKVNIIAQFKEPTFKHCALHCAEHRFCVAINFNTEVERNESNCQLTNTTAHKFDENISKKDRVWTFRMVTVDRSQVVSIVSFSVMPY